MNVDHTQKFELKPDRASRLRQTGQRLLLSIAALIVIVAGMSAAKAILIPFTIALLLAIVGTTPLGWLQRLGIHRGLAVIIVSIVFVVIGLGLLRVVGEGMQLFSSRLPEYAIRLHTLSSSLAHELEHFGIAVTAPTETPELFPGGSAVAVLGQMLRASVTAISGVLFVFIAMIFMLLEASELHRKSHAVLSGSLDISHVSKVFDDVRRYVGVKTMMSFLTGLLVGLLNWALGIEFALLWGFLAFLLNFIPIIGSNIAAIPPILITFMDAGSLPALTLITGYVVVNVGISNFLEPIVMGRKLGLSPLVVFLSLIFWGWLWGPAGALMSVPLTIIVKILFEHSSEFRWVSGLMDRAPDSEVKFK